MAEPGSVSSTASTAATAKIDLFRVHFVVIVISTSSYCDFYTVRTPEYDLYIKTA